MTAREIFEELGYMYFRHGTSILYVNDSEDGGYKSVKFYCRDSTFDAVKNYNEPLRIDFALFEAIQTQMRELGWI